MFRARRKFSRILRYAADRGTFAGTYGLLRGRGGFAAAASGMDAIDRSIDRSTRDAGATISR